MILPEKQLMFIHIPKTAGTYLEKWLLPHSDAEIVVGGWRDPEQRFELRGEYTRHKHMTIEQYKAAMPSEVFDRLHVVAAIRHPVLRSISFYFSPHRWVMKKRSARLRDQMLRVSGCAAMDRPSDYTTAKPFFSFELFEEVLKDAPSMTSYLTEGGKLRKLDYLIRHETFESDCLELARATGISPPETFKKVNKSTGLEAQMKKLAKDRDIINLVRRVYHEDFVNFDYE